jgi:hypothetical protein
MEGRDSSAEYSEAGEPGRPSPWSGLASDRVGSNTSESSQTSRRRSSFVAQNGETFPEQVLVHFLPFFFFLPPPLPPVVVGAACLLSGAGASFASAPPSAAGASSMTTSSGAARPLAAFYRTVSHHERAGIPSAFSGNAAICLPILPSPAINRPTSALFSVLNFSVTPDSGS